jgi:hypothetical protein
MSHNYGLLSRRCSSAIQSRSSLKILRQKEYLEKRYPRLGRRPISRRPSTSLIQESAMRGRRTASRSSSRKCGYLTRIPGDIAIMGDGYRTFPNEQHVKSARAHVGRTRITEFYRQAMKILVAMIYRVMLASAQKTSSLERRR